MRWSKLLTMGWAAAALGLFVFATSSQAGLWRSVVADNDFVGECFTTATGTTDPAIPGGKSCFGTTQFVPGRANVLRVTWSTSGDTHDGAALRMACRIRPASTGIWTFCNPTGSGAAPGDYITKNKLPTGAGAAAANNCNDGGGGDADCHDNSIEQTWCVPIRGDDVFDIDLRLASSTTGAAVFVEASYFFVDATKMRGQCGAGDASEGTDF